VSLQSTSRWVSRAESASRAWLHPPSRVSDGGLQDEGEGRGEAPSAGAVGGGGRGAAWLHQGGSGEGGKEEV